MGSGSSRVDPKPVEENEDDPRKYFHSLSLPPFPREVSDHCHVNNCSLLRKSITLNTSTVSGLPKERYYLVHEPHLLTDEKLPLVIALHGTDETITDTELIVQEDNQVSWLELSDRERFLLVFPQSLTYKAIEDSPVSWRELGDSMRSAWQPDHNDEQFISELLQHLYSIYPTIDQSQVYCIGYSNGGLFLTSLLLSHKFNLRFTAVCNYMGGVSPLQMTEEAGLQSESIQHHIENSCTSLVGSGRDLYAVHDDSTSAYTEHTNVFEYGVSTTDYSTSVVQLDSSDPPPIYIVTGTSDTNRSYCYTALCTFKELPGYRVYFDDLKGVKHEYQSSSTYDTWKFFKKHKRLLN